MSSNIPAFVRAADNSVCDLPISITLFANAKNEIGTLHNTTWHRLREWFNQQYIFEPDKYTLPLIKLAIFEGNHRKNANLQHVYGIEADYDGENLPVSEAVEILRRAGIESLVYTSPSYTEVKPRFRVLCPLFKPCLPQERSVYMARLNGVFCGVFGEESFVLSQSYFYGSVMGGYPMQCYHVAGSPIDLIPNLPSISGGKREISDRVNGKRVNGGLKARDYDMALKALRSCDVDVDRNTWLAISGAFYTATVGLENDERRLADWQAWNTAYETNDPSKNLTTWQDFVRNGTDGDFSTLAEMSDCANAKVWVDFGDCNFTPPTQTKARGFYFTRYDRLETTKQIYVVEGIMPEGLNLFFGQSGSGKSFVAHSIGMAIAAGVPWFGHITQKGDVIYICGEGKAGIMKRLKAWEERNGKNITPIPFFVSSMKADFPEPSSIAQVRQAITSLGIKPRLIIIDTLSRNFVGDENDTPQMNGFIRALDDLKDDYAASVLIVHHTGHGEKERARGSSALRAAMDAEYLIEKNEAGIITFHCTKMKDAEEPRDKKFELAPVTFVSNDFPQSSAVLTGAENSTLHERTRKTMNLLVGRELVSKDELFNLLVKDQILKGRIETQQRYFREILSDFRDKSLNPQWVGRL